MTRRLPCRLLGVALLLAVLSPAPPAGALGLDPAAVERRALGYFPGADRVGAARGTPPVRPVYAGNRLLGHVFLTDEVVALPGYSGRPIGALVGIDREGVVTGVELVRHAEPILGAGLAETDLERFVAQYVGRRAGQRFVVGGGARGGDVAIDGLSGATITTMVLNASIARALDRVRAATRAPASAAADGPAASGEAPAPLWAAVWEERRLEIALVGGGLLLLTVVLFVQDWLARHRSFTRGLRLVFLAYTLVVVGWYAGAQLSVINVLTFSNALMHDFRWETFLIDPLLFILWSYVAVTLLLWGRGVFCGWLCPYGALQELTNKLALRLRVPQLRIPELVHDRLLAIKYVVLLALFGLSLHEMAAAVRYAEVEPFKTAITLGFDRAWPFVAYAGGLVAVSAVNGKLFCKYLCPLGAALTIPSHFRIFDWLRRRPECGHPCQTCAAECPSQAIRPTGEINANECHYCLDCQVTYWDPYKCPPLVERRKRFERRGQPFRLG